MQFSQKDLEFRHLQSTGTAENFYQGMQSPPASFRFEPMLRGDLLSICYNDYIYSFFHV
jgi:hypothetical protein